METEVSHIAVDLPSLKGVHHVDEVEFAAQLAHQFVGPFLAARLPAGRQIAALEPGEGLLKFLASLTLQRFCGTVTMRLESGKATHVETETRRMWEHRDLPAGGANAARPAQDGSHGSVDRGAWNNPMS